MKHTDKEILDAIMDAIYESPYSSSAETLVKKVLHIHADMTREASEVEWLWGRVEALRTALTCDDDFGNVAAQEALQKDDAEVERRNKNSTSAAASGKPSGKLSDLENGA